MQTHEDRSVFLEKLHQRASEMTRNKESEITAGRDGEEPLAKWKHGGVSVCHMPEDEQGILRISVGGSDVVPLNYCVIRGDLGRCIDLLEKAIKALRAAP